MPDPKYKVLVVDDDPMMLRLVSNILALRGHRCEEARNGMEALDKFTASSFDAVITDIRMPRMDGVELARKLLQLRPALPIIVMTGHHDASIESEAIYKKASDFIYKPFSITDFLTRFSKVMSDHETP